jgi:hypothetical protein
LVYASFCDSDISRNQVAIREICKAIDVLVQSCGKKKMVDAINLPPPELYRHVEVRTYYSSLFYQLFNLLI